LGIDDFQELPVVLEKMEDQMSSVEMFISKLTNEVDMLEDAKKNINHKIQALKVNFQIIKIDEEKHKSRK
jgi:hypothetical protein